MWDCPDCPCTGIIIDHCPNCGLGKEEAMAKATGSGGYVRPDLNEEGETTSAGTSSSTSESKQGKNGGTAPETEESLQSPAQGTESLSVQEPSQQPSDADSAGGSTPETGPSPQSPQTSSEESTTTSSRSRRRTGSP